ncbi:hydantoinase/oxoprolinase family protein [Edaphobacillus lindanitolerans]|uniref:N-methylhydantoinase A n=1 Tax=Edaphobacillus lindanitolerans TaxID=550447 RepID=A0A1U7PNC0_9BACI|nr:hydantoinase/oxoprolinase family protein [Edaphobacillus lindanitolerans]SIT72906.1 N-methylhydantoinase A [Edaphobacillus lindanitolerans]
MRVATDIGGTFTDLVYVDDEGSVGYAKSNTTPSHFESGVIDVVQKSGLSPEEIEMFIHGSTVVINTLTEKKGVKVGLLTTAGTRDVLEIGRGNRPDLYNFRFQKPEPFVERHLRKEVRERLDGKGNVISELSTDDILQALEYFRKEKVEAIAVCYLHAYINPGHELETKRVIQEEWPEVSVTVSSEIIKEWREYERTNTTVLNAYVKPIAEAYIDRLSGRLDELGMTENRYIMQSNGGVTTFENAKNVPIHMVESGPVAGIFGAAMLGELIGEQNMIAFDIGGTTAKCSLITNGEVRVTTNYYIEKTEKTAGYPVKVPVVDIVEIGNGGGSVAWIDELGSLKVGPQSAGAMPGPVAYGNGGVQPTTTDANLFVGRLSKKNFENPVDMDEVKRAIDRHVADPFRTSTEDGAMGIIDIANSNMLNALKLVSVRKGYDPQDFTLVAFGGGGPMHAAELAEELGVKKIVVPNASSVFSAWGMLMTDLRHDDIRTYNRKLQGIDLHDLNETLKEMESESTRQFIGEGIDPSRVLFMRNVDFRYVGQEHTVKLPIPAGILDGPQMEELKARFHEAHEKAYSFHLKENEMEMVNLHLVGLGKVKKPRLSRIEAHREAGSGPKEVRSVYFRNGGWTDVPVYDRETLGAGFEMEGPAIVEEPNTSTLMVKGQRLQVDSYGNLIIETGVKE